MPRSPRATPTLPNHPLTPDIATLVRLLSTLTRKGARLERSDNDLEETYRIFIAGARQRSQPRETYAPAIVQTSLSAGWLKREAGSKHLRISEHGMLALHSGAVTAQIGAHDAADPSPLASRPERHRKDANPTDRLTLTRLTRQRDRSGKPLISGAEAEAGRRLARDFELGQLRQRVTTNWDRIAQGHRSEHPNASRPQDVSEHVSAAQERYRRTLADAGPNLSGILHDVCCLELGLEDIERSRGWSKGTARVVLQTALEWLARYYGTLDQAAAPAGRTRRWGAPDYKPT